MQLLDAGLNVNSWDSHGSKNTPLHWAACYGNKDIVTCLIGTILKLFLLKNLIIIINLISCM